MFLLDGSINFQRNSFQEVLHFVSEIVDTVYGEDGSIQVGLVQYNTDPTDEFFLKDFSTKQQIIDAINKVVYKGGRHANTRVGLEHLQQNHFVPEAGSRLDQRVPQIAFVIMGGKSMEDAQQASLALTQRGVKVFAVGLGNTDSVEAGKIASNSATAFVVGNIQKLSELKEQVLETLDGAMLETLCPGVTDVSKGNLRRGRLRSRLVHVRERHPYLGPQCGLRSPRASVTSGTCSHLRGLDPGGRLAHGSPTLRLQTGTVCDLLGTMPHATR